MAELIRRRANAAVKVHSAPARLMHNHIFTVATPTGVDARTQRVRAHMPPATTAALIKYLHASTHTSNRRSRPNRDTPTPADSATVHRMCIGLLERLTAKSAFMGEHLWHRALLGNWAYDTSERKRSKWTWWIGISEWTWNVFNANIFLEYFFLDLRRNSKVYYKE